jgi:hypothetical protein
MFHSPLPGNLHGRLALPLAGLLLLLANLASGQFQSSILHYDDSSRLVYHSDPDGYRIPDFSHAGYRNGEADLPEMPVVLEIGPVAGDNTSHIQAAIDQVSSLTPDTNGFRGALQLKPGLYPIHGVLYINTSGMVLRGSGEGTGSTENTILQGMGDAPHQRTLIVIGGNEKTRWRDEVPGSRMNVTSEYVPAGSRTIEVEDASEFKVGDNLIIRHPSTDAWLAAVDYGATHGDVLWQPGEIDLYFNRFVTRIEGNKIKMDAPLYHELDLSLSHPYVWIFTRSNLVTGSGIENLRIDIQTGGSLDEDHVWNGIRFVRVEDCWAKNVTVLHFGFAGFFFEDASRCTVLDCSALEPHSLITGSRRYNFNLGYACNHILFKGCHATEGRHAYVSNGTSTVSGIVFTDCSSAADHTSSESHRRWGQGLLWDRVSIDSDNTSRVLGLYNRGDWGTGHGWTGTFQVAWNVSAPKNQIVVQKPPIGQNYAIACKGSVTHVGPFNPHPAGWIEGTGENITPGSLYAAQLSERLTHGVGPDAPARLKISGYSYQDTTGQVALEWLDIALDEDGYVVERSPDGGVTFETLAQLEADTRSFDDSGLSAASYAYRVKAVNAIGSSAWSNVAVADLTTGIKSPVVPEVKIYPNPFQNKLILESRAGMNQVLLYDVAGSLIKAQNISGPGPVTIHAKDLEIGIYILQIYLYDHRLAFSRMVRKK